MHISSAHTPAESISPRDLLDISFDNTFVREMPADPSTDNIPRQVRGASYTRVTPSPVKAPTILAWADGVGELLGIKAPDSLSGAVADVLGGSRVLPGMAPYAARYGGHQFGHWAGQLGDGRAITLAEMLNAVGQRHELQLKGAGPTPYSRTADGRAVLRSSVREFMCSEAMHYLGVPTTRALSLVGTGEAVIRDMFYDGHPKAEPGAVVCRVAPSFIRFGNFEILAAQKEFELLKKLADYVIRTHFPLLAAIEHTPEIYAQWFEEICRRTAVMVAHWMRVGFVHGVMNTDNMSILGLTIDYGPYGWLEGFDPVWTPNTTDAEGRRYRYGNQPQIAHWNLNCLANALYPLINDEELLKRGLNVYAETFDQAARRMLADKLGWRAIEEDDEPLLVNLAEVLQAEETDMTLFFRGLADVPVDGLINDAVLIAPIAKAFYAEEETKSSREALTAWLRKYVVRVRRDGVPAPERRTRMNLTNPKYVLRNYLAQQAIDALKNDDAEGGCDASVLDRLMMVLKRPYDEQPEHEELAARRPEWARHKAGCSALSCSS